MRKYFIIIYINFWTKIKRVNVNGMNILKDVNRV